ncbi:MAG: hypothetical protein ACRD6W_19740, partial [Nitrososphaerales archaeon]
MLNLNSGAHARGHTPQSAGREQLTPISLKILPQSDDKQRRDNSLLRPTRSRGAQRNPVGSSVPFK